MVNIFSNFSNYLLLIVVAICDLVHDAEAIFHFLKCLQHLENFSEI